MRFDWYSATLLGDPDDVLRVFLQSLDLGEIVPVRGVNGYSRGARVQRGETVYVSVYWGSVSTAGYMQVIGSGDSAHWVSQVLRENFPDHRVTRADICEDYDDPLAWGQFDAMAQRLAKKFGMEGSYRIFGNGLNHEGGRTVYLGSKKSVVQLRIYEKGKKEGCSPTWVRVELVVNPKGKKAREWASSSLPAEFFGCARWAQDLGEFMGVQELKRVNVGTVYVKSNLEKRVAALVRQYGPTLLELLGEQCEGDPSSLGSLLVGEVLGSASRVSVRQLWAAARAEGPSPILN